MGYIETNNAGSSALVYLTTMDNMEYLEQRFLELPWVTNVEVRKKNLVMFLRTTKAGTKGKRSLGVRIGQNLKKFRLEAAETLHTASDDDNGWKDIIRQRTNDELIGHVGATPITVQKPEPTAITTDRPASPLTDIIREVGYSAGPVKVTVVGLYVSDAGGYDMTEVTIESLPS